MGSNTNMVKYDSDALRTAGELQQTMRASCRRIIKRNHQKGKNICYIDFCQRKPYTSSCGPMGVTKTKYYRARSTPTEIRRRDRTEALLKAKGCHFQRLCYSSGEIPHAGEPGAIPHEQGAYALLVAWNPGPRY